MTENKWPTSKDPQAMLSWVTPTPAEGPPGGWQTAGTRKRASDRKLRLFACACCRHVWRLLGDPRSRRTVEMAERYADGLATREEYYQVRQYCAGLEPSNYVWNAGAPDAPVAASNAIANAHHVGLEATVLAALLRDVVGNPFRPLVRASYVSHEARQNAPPYILESWLTPDVLALVQAAYEELLPNGALAADRLAILADALEEVGCPTEQECSACNGHGWVGKISFDGPNRTTACPARCHGGIGPHPILAHLRSPGPHVRACWALDLLLGKE